MCHANRNSKGACDAWTRRHLSVREHLGIRPTLGVRVYIDPLATVIGDVTLGDDVSVWPGAVIRGDLHRIRIGHHTNVQDNAVLHITSRSDTHPDGWPLTVGDNVTIGHHATLHGCTVGNRVLIGIGAIVLDGAVIPDDVMVGAGTLVPPGKQLESGHLYLGAPARKTRPLAETDILHLMEVTAHLVSLKDEYLSEK